MKPRWTYSVEWFELVEQDRRILFAETFDFESEDEAKAAHSFAGRFGWVTETQLDPHVSALYRIDYEVEGDQRVRVRGRRSVAPAPGETVPR